MLSGHDIASIANATGLPPHRFVILFRDDEIAFEPPGGAGLRLIADGPTMSMALEQYYGSPTKPRCVFLMELADGQARCAVYAHRPAVCASFPFDVTDGVTSIRTDTLCGSDDYQIAGHDLQSRGVNVARAAFEWRLYRIIVAHWNQRVDSQRPRVFSRTELFDYLLEADRRIDQLRSEYTDDELIGLMHAAMAENLVDAAVLNFLAEVTNILTAMPYNAGVSPSGSRSVREPVLSDSARS
jgi:Fe-S-cluster containining protein